LLAGHKDNENFQGSADAANFTIIAMAEKGMEFDLRRSVHRI